jgi:uncharacterized protein
MSREFPDFIDPWKAADGRRTFQGTMPIQRMQRLLPLLAPADKLEAGQVQDYGLARFTADFSYDRQGLLTIALEVEADVSLICQRSLAPYVEKIKRKSNLTVIEEVAEHDSVPEHYDPVLVEHRRMALQDIVEEELLLAIPQVPRNPEIGAVDLSTDGKIAPPSEPVEEKTHRPFAALAGLMKSDTED